MRMVTALALMGLATLTAAVAQSPADTTKPPPFAGLYKGGGLDTFAETMDMPVRMQGHFNGRHDGWAPVEGRERWGNVASNGENPDRMFVVGYAPIPQLEKKRADPPGSRVPLERCARGDYDQHYVTFAHNMKNQNITSMVLRIAWEFNLDSWPWGIGNDPELGKIYAQCYRRIVDIIEREYPENRFLYSWGVNQDASVAAMDAAWPGENYVDLFDLDIYDTFFGNQNCARDPECRWQRRTQKVLTKFENYTQRRNLPIGISEWGLWTTEQPRGGGDNPYFIERFCKWLANPHNNVVYHVYFGTKLHDLRKFPKSTEAYRQHCPSNPGNPHQLLPEMIKR